MSKKAYTMTTYIMYNAQNNAHTHIYIYTHCLIYISMIKKNTYSCATARNNIRKHYVH